MTRAALMFVVALAACADSGGVTLARFDGWKHGAGDADPYPLESRTPCPASQAFVEDDLLELKTQSCNHITMTQPLQASVPAGAQVVASMSYTSLIDTGLGEPSGAGTAVIILDVGPLRLTRAIDLPAMPAAFSLSATAETALPAGTPVYFHVHNHGSNSYRLYSLTRK
jgi:hypothetical protein